MKTIVILSHVAFDDSPYCSYVHNHAKELVKQGYRVIVFAIIHWLPFFSHFQKYKKNFMNRIKEQDKIQVVDGVEVIYKKATSVSNFLYDSKINLNGMFYYRSIRKMFRKIYKKEDIVLIDAHTFKIEGYVASKLKDKYGIPTTVTLHGTSFFRNTKTKNGIKSIKKVFGKVDYAICVSSKIEKILEQFEIKNKKVIFNGVNAYDFPKINKEEYKNNIISVGALITRKNFDITIKAVKEALKYNENIKLTIVGTGVEKENLLELIKKENIEEHVCFTGQITNQKVMDLMNKSYIFILPSSNEGFGIVYVEAMKSGAITIGTIGEGIDGFIKNGENGFLIEPKVENIVKLIKDIYDNKYDFERIRKNAYKDAKELTWEKNAREYAELLNG